MISVILQKASTRKYHLMSSFLNHAAVLMALRYISTDISGFQPSCILKINAAKKKPDYPIQGSSAIYP
jgi:hypothetical protein